MYLQGQSFSEVIDTYGRRKHPQEGDDRIMIGWAPPQSKNVDLLAERPEEVFHKVDMGDVCQTGRLDQAEGGG